MLQKNTREITADEIHGAMKLYNKLNPGDKVDNTDVTAALAMMGLNRVECVRLPTKYAVNSRAAIRLFYGSAFFCQMIHIIRDSRENPVSPEDLDPLREAMAEAMANILFTLITGRMA